MRYRLRTLLIVLALGPPVMMTTGCETKRPPPATSVPTPSVFAVADVFAMADSIEVIDTSENQASLANTAIRDPQICTSIAKMFRPLEFIDTNGESVTTNTWIQIRVSRNSLVLADYVIFMGRSIAVTKSGRGYLANLGGVEVYAALEKHLVEQGVTKDERK